MEPFHFYSVSRPNTEDVNRTMEKIYNKIYNLFSSPSIVIATKPKTLRDMQFAWCKYGMRIQFVLVCLILNF
jgi:hypothetical protein